MYHLGRGFAVRENFSVDLGGRGQIFVDLRTTRVHSRMAIDCTFCGVRHFDDDRRSYLFLSRGIGIYISISPSY